jgi:hypothetical protein
MDRTVQRLIEEGGPIIRDWTVTELAEPDELDNATLAPELGVLNHSFKRLLP